MLATTYRIQAYNSTGVALGSSDSVVVKARRWNLTSGGARNAEASEATLLAGGANLASGATLNGTTQDNTAAGTLWFGAELRFTVTISTATPSGTFFFVMQVSTDGGTTWPDAGTGELLKTLSFTSTGTQTQSVSF